MRTLVTGLHGTVAPALARRLRADGHEIVAWDRTAVPPDQPGAVQRFVHETAPDWVLHVATGPAEWAEALAREAAAAGAGFLFTSTVSVFGAGQRGPFAPADQPHPDDDYGRYKLDAEQRVCAAHPGAYVARLAWQVGEAPGSNTLTDYLHRTATAEGRVEASTRWLPALAWLDDTADAVARLLARHPPGLYHLDANPGVSLYEVACRLRDQVGAEWNVVATEAPERDNRMADARVAMRPLTARLVSRRPNSVSGEASG